MTIVSLAVLVSMNVQLAQSLKVTSMLSTLTLVQNVELVQMHVRLKLLAWANIQSLKFNGYPLGSRFLSYDTTALNMKRILSGLLMLMSMGYGMNMKAQVAKPALDHSVYKIWQNVGGFHLTDDGKYASYLTNVGEGDGSVSVVDLKKTETVTIPRGSRAKFSFDGKYMYLTIRPFYEQTQEAKRKKLKGDKLPKDTLAIMNLKTKEISKFPGLKKVESPREAGNYIAFNVEVDKKAIPADSIKDAKKKKAKNQKETLTLVYGFKEEMVVDTLRNVDVMLFDESGKQLFCIATDSTKQLFVYNPETKVSKVILEAHKKADIQRPVISEDGNRIAFYANTDDTKKFDENVEIYTCRMNVENPKPVKVVTNEIPGLPQGMLVSKNRAITFNKKGDRMFFGVTYPIAKKDSTIKDEQASLDVWHYQDPYIATQYLQVKGMAIAHQNMWIYCIIFHHRPNSITDVA